MRESIEARVRILRRVLQDALRHAADVAMTAQEATEQSEATLLFNDARLAIQELQEHPAMKALASFAVRDRI